MIYCKYLFETLLIAKSNYRGLILLNLVNHFYGYDKFNLSKFHI